MEDPPPADDALEPARVVRGEVSSDGSLGDFLGADGGSLPLWSDEAASEPTTPFLLLRFLAWARATGLLGLSSHGETIVLSLRSGWLVKTASSLETDDEALAMTLLESGILSREKIHRAAVEAESTGRELGRVLYDRRHLEPKAAVRALRQLMRRHVTRAMQMSDATYTFARDDVLGGKRLPTGPAKLAALAALRAYLSAYLKTWHHTELAPALEVYRDRYLEVPPGAQKALPKLGFDKRQRHTAAELIIGAHQPAEITRLSVMSKNRVSRLLFSLGALGLLDAHTEPIAEAAVFSTEQRLALLLEDLGRCDHFERLGSHWTAHVEQIHLERDLLAADFGPSGRYRREPGAASELAEQIWALMEASWAVVRERSRREAYRAQTVDPVRMRHAAQLLIAQARTFEIQTRWDDARRRYEAAQEFFPTEEGKQALATLGTKQKAWLKRQRERSD